MPNRVSAVESISPAFTRTKLMLFRPFRFGLWARLAVVALITGESGGAGGGSSFGNFNGGQGGGQRWRAAAHLFSESGWEQVQPYLFWIVLCFAAVIGLILLWVYCDCVYRFILLDSVLTGQCQLREGWRKWRANGRQYFLWVLAFGFGSLALLGIVAGLPIWLAYRAGWFHKSDEHFGALLGGGMLLGLVVFGLIVVLAIIDLFARDFLIPVMALENVDAAEGWQRLLEMLGADKLAYAGYVLMKIVLAVGGAIIFTIVNLIVIIVLLIPLALIGVIGFLVGRGMGVNWDGTSVILLLVAFALLALAGILYAVGFVYAPGLVFFQSYTLEFFASRYGALGRRMFPPPPPAPPLAPPMEPPPIAPLVPGDSFPV